MHKALRRAAAPIAALLVIAYVYAVVHLALGTHPFAHSGYDTYTLQALAWREGRISLGQDYPHLELAVYEGDWYVSFPPVPALVQLPLTLLFGRQTPDGLLVKLYVAGAFLALYDYFRRAKRQQPWSAAAWALFFVFGSNMVSVSLDGGVWYQAQTLNFLLLACAVAAMARMRPTLSCALYALAVGCRPFTALFGPVLLMMYLARRRPRARLFPGILVGLCIAACYAAYNYARFGNPFEFGHNYLPEFTRAQSGQFSISHVAGNIRTFVFGLPFSLQNGQWTLNRFGFSMFLCNPALWMMFVWLAARAQAAASAAGGAVRGADACAPFLPASAQELRGPTVRGALHAGADPLRAVRIALRPPTRAARVGGDGVFAGDRVQRRGRVPAQLLRRRSGPRVCALAPPGVLAPRGHAAAQVALTPVLLQHLTDLGEQAGVDLFEPQAHVLVDGGLAHAESLGALAHGRAGSQYVPGGVHNANMNLPLHPHPLHGMLMRARRGI